MREVQGNPPRRRPWLANPGSGRLADALMLQWLEYFQRKR
jgi:hypothetical protein